MTPPSLTRRTLAANLAAYALLFLLAALLCPLAGGVAVPPVQTWLDALAGRQTTETDILLFQRVPRVLLGLLAGGSLALAGAVFQVLLRNPLAEPYTLGVTGGSAVGAVFAITVPGVWYQLGPLSTVQLFSIAGASLSLGLIYIMSRRPEGMMMNTLLLAGVTVSVISVGFILFLRYLARPDYLVQIDRWMMGGLEVSGYAEAASILPLLLPALGVLFSCMAELNHLALGGDMASGHGVDVESVRRRAFFGGAVATAAVVSVTGPIGFVGLIVPHAVRRVSGFDHRVVLPASFLAGGAALTLCDAAARTLLAPREMPVGIITALIGGPLFIWILLKRN